MSKGRKVKITAEISEYVDRQLREGLVKDYTQLAAAVLTGYGISLSKASISKRAKALGLQLHRGRKRVLASGRRPAHAVFLDCAGAFFLKGAELETGLLDAINQIFNVESDSPQARKALSLAQKINAFLLYAPMFELATEEDISRYRRRGLCALAEAEAVPDQKELQQYSEFIRAQNLLPYIVKEVTKNCAEAFYISVEYEGQTFYLDAQAQTVWANTKIPQIFSTTLNKSISYVNNTFITATPQNPLILLTAPGYTVLPPEAFTFIHCLEKAHQLPIAKIVVQGKSAEVLSSWETITLMQKGYFIFPLTPWQFERLVSTKAEHKFHTYRIGPRRVPMEVADSQVSLPDPQLNETIKLRAVLVRKNNETIALVTNISRREERYVRKIADKYFDRWPKEKIKTYYDIMEEAHAEMAARSQKQVNLDSTLSGADTSSAQKTFLLFLEYLSRYAKFRFFPSELEKEPLKLMREKIYRQGGYLRIKKDAVEVILNPFAEKTLQNAVSAACAKFNQCGLKLHNKKELCISLLNNE